MDFLDAAHMLMDLQAKVPAMSYQVVDNLTGPAILVNIPVDPEVAKMFSQAFEMFKPA